MILSSGHCYFQRKGPRRHTNCAERRGIVRGRRGVRGRRTEGFVVGMIEA